MNNVNVVIIHYTNGKSYTYKGWKVQGVIDWKGGAVTLVPQTKSVVNHLTLSLPVDTLGIEVVQSYERHLTLNPRHRSSVRTSVLTVGRRVKEHNKKQHKEEKSIKDIVVKPTLKDYNDKHVQLKWHHVADGDWEAVGRVNHYTISVSPKDFMFHLFVNGFTYGSEGHVEDLKQVAQDIEINS